MQSTSTSSTPKQPAAAAATPDPAGLVNLLKSPLLNPALLTINPQLYAMQLAQLQAALAQSAGLQQLVAAAAMPKKEEDESSPQQRKRKLDEEHDLQQQQAVLNLTNSASKRSPVPSPTLAERLRAESPLDLSGSKRHPGLVGLGSPAKTPKLEDGKFAMPPWAGSFPFLNPFMNAEAMQRFPGAAAAAAAAAAAGMPGAASALSPPSPATSVSSLTPGAERNPLEKMSEIAKSGGQNRAAAGGGGQRQSAWQSQWINRGPEATKDIFKCVWCKDSFNTLQALTTHMRDTKHFGSSIPPSPQVPVRPPSQQHPTPPAAAATAPRPQLTPPTPPVAAAATSTASASKSRDILKEQLPLPRKLVRGQDVWLGRGEQQTKDILKCMWCGESFRSLDLMTKHMQETKHYTKVISQEQLVSWKSTDQTTSSPNHVNAVLTCKVCEQAFSTLKELSDHMVKNNHYKDTPSRDSSSAATSPASAAAGAASPPAMIAAAAAAAPTLPGSNGARPPPPPMPIAAPPTTGGKEKRKKSLPVRKLLELERAQQELAGQFKAHMGDLGAGADDSPGKISCEKCGDKILMHLFVDHIRQCVGPLRLPPTSMAELAANPLFRRTPSVSPPRPGSGSRPPTLLHDSDATTTPTASPAAEPKSILGSLEKMVQNNFGAKRRAGPDNNMSILQRLGIDEGVDYSKPLVDPMAMFRPPAMSPGAAAAIPVSTAAARLVAAGLFPPVTTLAATETRSNSECSSPDRFRQERPPSIKSEHSSSAKSASPPPQQQPLPATDFRKSGSSSPKHAVALPPSNTEDEATEKPKDEPEEKMEVDIEAEKPQSVTKSVSPPTSPVRPNRISTPGSTKETSSPSTTPKPSSTPEDGDKDSKNEKDEETTEVGGEKKKKSHPLAALQMLCDKTEKTPKVPTTTSAYGGGAADPGAILAFSWACNQAVVNDSLLKCPFCDTPFISKGAYRHHLSKMHFVKDGQADPKMLMAAAAAAAAGASPAAVAAAAAAAGERKTPPGGSVGDASPGPSGGSASDAKEENAQSKFAKYSQLAKQLSCSSQP